jgi:hypothetical protein
MAEGQDIDLIPILYQHTRYILTVLVSIRDEWTEWWYSDSPVEFRSLMQACGGMISALWASGNNRLSIPDQWEAGYHFESVSEGISYLRKTINSFLNLSVDGRSVFELLKEAWLYGKVAYPLWAAARSMHEVSIDVLLVTER